MSVAADKGVGEGHRLVIRPERQSEAVRLVDARLNARIRSGHRARHRVEAFRQLDLEGGDLVPRMGHAGNDIAGQQTSSELVRVAKDDRLVGGEAQPGGRRHSCRDRPPHVGCMHDWIVAGRWRATWPGCSIDRRRCTSTWLRRAVDREDGVEREVTCTDDLMRVA